ncbi:MAG: efflux RND transporter periplasmic adaptor subunit [Ignavibacteriales bacterium]|nr:efflux RND transporter periplasmic adaptor subunit [Ignavibacteriales bacterium]
MKTNNLNLKILMPILFFTIVIGIVFNGCTGKKENPKEQIAHSTMYYCPMHPQVTSDKQGVCPICHMDLVLQSADVKSLDGAVNLSGERALLAGVKTEAVTVSPLVKEIKAYSTLEIPEQNRKIVSAKFGGRIEQLSVAQTGVVVRKGDVLFTAYSPDVYRTASEYLVAKSASDKNPGAEAKKLLNSISKRLELYGVPEQYITDVEKTGEAAYTFKYLAPYSGVVIKKNIVEGGYISEGTELYELADISHLWSVADIFEADVTYLKPQMPVQVTFPALPGETFTGKISFISPVVESESRTVKVRIDVPNNSGKLRARMYGESSLSVNLGTGILINADAIIFTGKRNVVWVKRDSATFEPRDIRVGAKFGSMYQVTAGLAAGEEIVLNGNYLIDSESRLKSGGHGEHKSDASTSVAPQVAQTTATAEYITKDNAVFKKFGVFNSFCPVLGDEVADEGPLLLYKGKVIGFCCKGCDKKFIKDPEKYFSYISTDGKKYTGPTE